MALAPKLFQRSIGVGKSCKFRMAMKMLKKSGFTCGELKMGMASILYRS